MSSEKKVSKLTPDERAEFDKIDMLKVSRRTDEQKKRWEELKSKTRRAPNAFELFAKDKREAGLTETEIRNAWCDHKEGNHLHELAKKKGLSESEQKQLSELLTKMQLGTGMSSPPVVSTLNGKSASGIVKRRKKSDKLTGEGLGFKEFCAKYAQKYKGNREGLLDHWRRAKLEDAR